MVNHHQFRSDLYYRLNVFPIELPPLRERREDIAPLVLHYVEIFARRMGKRIDEVPAETLSAFEAYPWPGNVRELQNLIERAMILSDDGLFHNPLPKQFSAQIGANPQPRTLKDSERALILRTLEAAGWVIGGATGAAAKLGLKRTTLIAKMKKLGITRPERQTDVGVVDDLPSFVDPFTRIQ
jgi:formate hydrogenlyase transcriptional activator